MADDSVDLDEPIDDEDGANGALAAAFNPTTTPEAQQYSRAILNQDVIHPKEDMGENQLFNRMQANADQVRAALEAAKRRLLSYQISPAQKLLAVGSAFGTTSPTAARSGHADFGSIASSLGDQLTREQQFQMQKDQGLLGLDQSIAGVDQNVLNAQAQLARIKRQSQGKLDVEALRTLSRQLLGQARMMSPEEKIARGELPNGTPEEIAARVAKIRAENLAAKMHPGGAGGAIDPEAIDFGSYLLFKTGKMPALGMGNAPARSAILSGAAKLALREAGGEDVTNQGFDQAIANNQDFSAAGRALGSFAGGPLGNQARSLNNVVGHLKLFEDTFSALNNGDVQTLNKLGNAWNKEFGKPAPVSLKAMAEVIGPELTKVLAGANAGTGEEREQFAKEAGSLANSPEAVKDALEKVRGMLGRQATDLALQYHGATGRSDFAKRYLHPDVVSVLELDPEDASSPKTPPAQTLPPQVVSKLREGQNSVFGNGQVWTLQGGKPVRVR